MATLAQSDSGDQIVVAVMSIGVVSLIGALIGAIILRAAVWGVVKQEISFGKAFVTALVGLLAGSGVNYLITRAAGGEGADGIDGETRIAAAIASFVVGTLVQAGVIRLMLGVRFLKAILVALLMFAIVVAIVVMFMVIIGVVGGVRFGAAD